MISESSRNFRPSENLRVAAFLVPRILHCSPSPHPSPNPPPHDEDGDWEEEEGDPYVDVEEGGVGVEVGEGGVAEEQHVRPLHAPLQHTFSEGHF